jgi:putative transposase
MTHVIQPVQLLVIAMTGWLERHQQAIIDYLIEENRVLKEQLEGQRFRFTDEQRIRLAVKAKAPGRQILDELETLVTPDTLLIYPGGHSTQTVITLLKQG